jgi:hypothetical protein
VQQVGSTNKRLEEAEEEEMETEGFWETVTAANKNVKDYWIALKSSIQRTLTLSKRRSQPQWVMRVPMEKRLVVKAANGMDG